MFVSGVMVVGAGIGIYSAQTRSYSNELDLINIEALASGEITTPTDCPGGTILCAWIKGPGGESVTYYKRS